MAGLTETASNTALEAVLPNGTNVYIGLFTAIPTARDGTGGTEATGSGYARLAHAAWVNVVENDISKRENNGAISLAALTGALSGIVAWGIWDAITVGNLLAFGPTQNAGGVDTTFNYIATDQPRFLDGELKVGINDAVN